MCNVNSGVRLAQANVVLYALQNNEEKENSQRAPEERRRQMAVQAGAIPQFSACSAQMIASASSILHVHPHPRHRTQMVIDAVAFIAFRTRCQYEDTTLHVTPSPHPPLPHRNIVQCSSSSAGKGSSSSAGKARLLACGESRLDRRELHLSSFLRRPEAAGALLVHLGPRRTACTLPPADPLDGTLRVPQHGDRRGGPTRHTTRASIKAGFGDGTSQHAGGTA